MCKKEDNKELKKKLELAQQVINQLKENNNNLAQENYKINELNKYLKEL